MTIFSFILILLICYFLIKKKSWHEILISIFTLGIFISINIELGYFISIGSFNLSYNEFIYYTIALISIIHLINNKKKYNLGIIYSSNILILSVFISTLLLIINTYSKNVILYNLSWDDFVIGLINKQYIIPSFGYYKKIIKLIFFCITLIVASQEFEKKDWIRINNRLTKLFKFVIIYGCIEIIAKYYYHSNITYVIINTLFGVSDSSVTELTYRGNGFILQGFTKESSHYVFTFIFIFLSFILNRKFKKISKLWFVLAAILFYSSMSFSTLLFSFTIFGFYILYKLKKEDKSPMYFFLYVLFFLLFLLVVFIFLYTTESYYFVRIEKMIFELNVLLNGKWENLPALGLSERARFLSIIDTFKIFFDRPLFGVGLGTVTCHGSLVIVLSNIGFFGFVAWVNLLWFRFTKAKYNSIYYILAMFLWFITNIFVSNGLGFLYDFKNIFLVILLSLIYIDDSFYISKVVVRGAVFNSKNDELYKK